MATRILIGTALAVGVVSAGDLGWPILYFMAGVAVGFSLIYLPRRIIRLVSQRLEDTEGMVVWSDWNPMENESPCKPPVIHVDGGEQLRTHEPLVPCVFGEDGRIIDLLPHNDDPTA